MLVEDLHRSPRPRRGGGGGLLRLRRQRLRAQNGVAVAEEGVRVGDALVGRVRDAQDPLPAADVLEGEGEAVDLEMGAGVDEGCGVLLVLAVTRPAGQPQPVLAPLRGSKGREGERIPRVHLLAVAEGLEDRARPGNSSGR